MSIAISAVVQPSRMLTFIVMTMTALCVGISMYTAMVVADYLPLAPRLALPALALFGVVLVCRWVKFYRIPYRIDISNAGQIRIALPQSRDEKNITPQNSESDVQFFLLPTSTIWATMLVLNLRSDNGKAITLMMFYDSLSRESFRTLSVACRWIAGRGARQCDEET